MGTAGAARVDTAAVRGIAREYETTASILDGAARTHLDDIDIGGATSGRAYVAQGEALRAAVFGVAMSLREWSRASLEIAAVLRATVDRYQDADAGAAMRVG